MVITAVSGSVGGCRGTPPAWEKMTHSFHLSADLKEVLTGISVPCPAPGPWVSFHLEIPAV